MLRAVLVRASYGNRPGLNSFSGKAVFEIRLDEESAARQDCLERLKMARYLIRRRRLCRAVSVLAVQA